MKICLAFGIYDWKRQASHVADTACFGVLSDILHILSDDKDNFESDLACHI